MALSTVQLEFFLLELKRRILPEFDQIFPVGGTEALQTIRAEFSRIARITITPDSGPRVILASTVPAVDEILIHYF